MSSPPSSPLFPPSPASPGGSPGVYGGGEEVEGDVAPVPLPIARRCPPPLAIPGLTYQRHFFASDALVAELLDGIAACNYFDAHAGRNQAFLFLGRPTLPSSSPSSPSSPSSAPAWLSTLLDYIRTNLDARVPGYALVFPQSPDDNDDDEVEKETEGRGWDGRSRQVILNLYEAGQGLASHIDLPHQFDDGILVCSFGSGCTMRFSREGGAGERGQEKGQNEEREQVEHVYLEDRSLVLLSGESRWAWKHGIEARDEDLVEGEAGEVERIRRGKRLSITVRWLLSHEERQKRGAHKSDDVGEEVQREQSRVARRI